MLQSVGLQKVRHDRATEQQQRRAVVVGEQAPCAGGWNCTWQLIIGEQLGKESIFYS